MTTHRFYLPPAEWATTVPSLTAAEAHHCINVLRLAEADKVTLFDGKGKEASATILHIAKERVELKLGPALSSPKLRCAITLAQAIPKGRNMDLIVQTATELGASQIVPLLSERAVVRLDEGEAIAKKEKWQSIVVEAAKQCGQNWLPQVATPISPKDFFASNPRADLMLIGSLQQEAKSLKSLLAEFPPEKRPSSVIVFIGPEGDFTPAELGMARSSGCRALSLGPIVLRTETAAIYTLSVLAHELQASE
jgi:16S rRNA (uracil1498-N3)-methyltransferase